MAATRTWVSGLGNDANPCSRTAPCKTFAGALSKTAPGGEISVLDPGGFGGVTITKGVTLNGDGTLASILTAGAAPGIIVNAAPTDTVILRNLSISGGGSGGSGIRYIAGGAVHVENCSINGLAGHGIEVNLTAPGRLFVMNTTICACGASNGVNIVATGSTATASLENVCIERCSSALHPASGSRVSIRNSVLAGNTVGLLAEQTAADMPKVTIERCRLSGNSDYGIRTLGTVQVRVSNCVICDNGNGWLSSGGVTTLISFGNNLVKGNGTDGTPTSTETLI